MEVPAILKKKVGPFPVGVWVVIGVAGVGAVYLYKRSQAGGGSFGGLPENEADNVYGVPIDSPDDEYYEEVPASAPPAPGGQPGTGGFFYPPYGYDPIPGEFPTEPILAAPVVATCTQPTQPARFGGYPSAPNRACPHGWHEARQGPCIGRCIRNVG